MPKRPSRERISTSLAPVHAVCTRCASGARARCVECAWEERGSAHVVCMQRACGVHAACMWCACGVHAARMHAVERRTAELCGEEVLRRCAQVELVDVVLREDGPLGATVEPGLAARGLQLLREQVQESRLARAVRPAEHEGST